MGPGSGRQRIKLDFGTFSCIAELFDTDTARAFARRLPCSVDLSRWGDELYGPVDMDFAEENPVSHIPPGGIAYSTQGNLLCIFYGQEPAWPVEHIGQVEDDSWKRLRTSAQIDTLVVTMLSGGSKLN